MSRITISISPEQSPVPLTNLGQLRRALRALGAPPACLRFEGCRRQLYTAARQVNVEITVRRQKDGSHRVWRLSKPGPLAAARPQPELYAQPQAMSNWNV